MAESDEPLLDFNQALAVAEHVYNAPTPAVLLGNGFSRAFDNKFGYETLRKEAALGSLSNGVTKDDLFDHAGTNDFETVIHTLERAAQLQQIYDPFGTLSAKLRADAEVVKRGLVDTLTAIHPPSAAEVESAKYAGARSFLRCFSAIFTLNYDMLLYWAVNQPSSLSTLTPPRDDGFRLRDGNLTWISPGLATQRVYFLHGAMHLYADGSSTYKLSGSGGHIIKQVQENLANGRYPLVVTEGTRENKQVRIAVNPYLSHCYNRLKQQDGVLFVHGMALSENDQHILDAVSDVRSGVTALFVGLFGDEFAHRDVKHRAKGVAVERRRRGGQALDVLFYQSETAEIWG
ncbi:DUF4917 family protein [Mycolicibacterium austroafricanum]|uniref:DUF4917 family protein n=1 Tax=Mycolicibacterium austroafricanum TaxID=39687 RepID=A0ABT8HD49_MYCAO|nr:DUF4917 family protein [Mycolicibacterium austroafricanum]MDN4518677.1 DUF4917 family protein [Mycolicibacterium austroafricanum]